jgi:beta-lactamase class D
MTEKPNGMMQKANELTSRTWLMVRAGTRWVLPCAFCLLPLLCATRPQAQGTSPTHSCVVIVETAPGSRLWRSDDKSCATRLSPASTFKIPHALVGLETGVITTATVEKWDGTPYPQQPEWQHEHTVLTAMRPSVLWFFQRMAPKIGAARMRGWLERFHYGNADTSGDVTLYWVNGRLRVSPDEQVRFLQLFFADALPFKHEHQREIRQTLTQRPGTVQNARGVHPLEGRWDASTVLTAKTGAATAEGQGVSWLVGQIAARGRAHVFASAVWRNDGTVDGLDAARLAVRTFIERGLLER